MKMDQTVVLHN